MKKGLFLIYNSLNLDKPDGIEKKILAQRKMFEQVDIKMEFEILSKVNGTYWHYRREYSQYDFLYFRKSTAIDLNFILFFSALKKNNPKIKVFMDIPTYPYEGEFGGSLKSKIALYIDKLFRHMLKNKIDRIIVTGNETKRELWGIRTINVVNGIDFDDIPVRNIKDSKNSKREINIVCIAKFSPWHGYERLIMGLKNYYDKTPCKVINIIMVGDGVELEHYKFLTKKYNLSEYVYFTGQLLGQRLQDIYDIADIGCCSLGRYKSGINVIGDLKSREFMAQGLPMICGCDIDVLVGKNYQYAIFFPNNDSPIDLDKVVDFYQKLIFTYGAINLYKNIRNEAKHLVDLKSTYSPVIKEAIAIL